MEGKNNEGSRLLKRDWWRKKWSGCRVLDLVRLNASSGRGNMVERRGSAALITDKVSGRGKKGGSAAAGKINSRENFKAATGLHPNC
jgi:hypothetical protein